MRKESVARAKNHRSDFGEQKRGGPRVAKKKTTLKKRGKKKRRKGKKSCCSYKCKKAAEAKIPVRKRKTVLRRKNPGGGRPTPYHMKKKRVA